MPFGNEFIIAVEISNHMFQKIGALNQTIGQCFPLALLNEDRHMTERPVTLRRFSRIGAAVEYTRIAKILIASQKSF